MQEKPRCAMKMVYSCFDCLYFVNRAAHVQIEMEKYRCMVEMRDFSFDEMSPEGVPKWCPLPYFTDFGRDPMAKPFIDVFRKLEKGQQGKK